MAAPESTRSGSGNRLTCGSGVTRMPLCTRSREPRNSPYSPYSPYGPYASAHEVSAATRSQWHGKWRLSVAQAERFFSAPALLDEHEAACRRLWQQPPRPGTPPELMSAPPPCCVWPAELCERTCERDGDVDVENGCGVTTGQACWLSGGADDQRRERWFDVDVVVSDFASDGR